MSGHNQRKHALLGASKAGRWLQCTPSARLEDEVPEKNSFYAEEGTLAHELAEIELRAKFVDERNDNFEYADFQDSLVEIKQSRHFSDEMPEEVNKFVNYVSEQFIDARRTDPATILLLEDKVDYSDYVPEGFGTTDVGIISQPLLEIVDLKYGRGVRVDAEGNPQLKLYALGSYVKYKTIYDIDRVKLTIVQPRLNHFSSVEYSIEELLDWAENEVIPKAELAIEGKGELVAGKHCRFCKVAGSCKALSEFSQSIAKKEFSEKAAISKSGANPNALTDQEIMEVFHKLPILEFWAAAVKEHMIQSALEGKDWPGLKLVEGRSQRKFTDEEKVKETLRKKKYRLKDFTVNKLTGITAIEKLLGRDKFEKYLSNYITKPEGKPTLVDLSDKRPPLRISSAQKDFEEE